MKILPAAILSLIAAAVVFCLVWLIAWAGGYNFDTRNPDVALSMFLSLVLSGASWLACFSLLRGNSK